MDRWRSSLGLFLALTLVRPSVALALRAQAGLESAASSELEAAFPGGSRGSSAAFAGLEEDAADSEVAGDTEFGQVMDWLGLTQEGMAQALAGAGYNGGKPVSRETISRWRGGEGAIPGKVMGFLPRLLRNFSGSEREAKPGTTGESNPSGLEEGRADARHFPGLAANAARNVEEGDRGIAMAVAMAEASVEGIQAVVLDAATLDADLVQVLRRLDRFAGRLVLLGESELAEGLVGENRRIHYVPERSPDAVTTAFQKIHGLSRVTYLGPLEHVYPVRVAADVLRLYFAQELFSMDAILKGFGVSPDLVSILAAGLEQSLGIGSQA